MLKTTIYFFVGIIILSSCNTPNNDKPAKQVAAYTIEQLQNNLSLSGAGFNSDETKLLTTHNGSGIFNVYELNLSDTASKPLTSSTKESFYAVDYVPGTSNFIYSADQGGNENSHLYLRKSGDTSAKDITHISSIPVN